MFSTFFKNLKVRALIRKQNKERRFEFNISSVEINKGFLGSQKHESDCSGCTCCSYYCDDCYKNKSFKSVSCAREYYYDINKKKIIKKKKI